MDNVASPFSFLSPLTGPIFMLDTCSHSIVSHWTSSPAFPKFSMRKSLMSGNRMALRMTHFPWGEAMRFLTTVGRVTAMGHSYKTSAPMTRSNVSPGGTDENEARGAAWGDWSSRPTVTMVIHSQRLV